MGWSLGFIGGRDVGYGVPAWCEHPKCKKKIDRGLSFACGGFPDSEYGCGLFFCDQHMTYATIYDGDETVQCCEPCAYRNEHSEDDYKTFPATFEQKPDHPQWIRWKLKDKSWAEWRENNAEEVQDMKDFLANSKPRRAKASQEESSK